MLFLFAWYRKYCVIHDIVMDYLQQSIYEQKSLQCLHEILLESYCSQCQRNWSSYPNDKYFYQYVVFHAIQAGSDSILQDIMTDFNWMDRKINISKSLYPLKMDLQNYIQYLKQTNQVIFIHIDIKMGRSYSIQC